MKFCPECGTEAEGKKFCPECGNNLGGAATAVKEPEVADDGEEKTLLEFSTYMFGMDGKANVGGKFDLSLPKENYRLTDSRLFVTKKGVAMEREIETMELYNVKDVSLTQGMKEKLLKVGNITIDSIDPSTPSYTMRRIQNPHEVRDKIRKAVLDCKKNMGVSFRQHI